MRGIININKYNSAYIFQECQRDNVINIVIYKMNVPFQLPLHSKFLSDFIGFFGWSAAASFRVFNLQLVQAF